MYLWPLVCFCVLAVSYCDGDACDTPLGLESERFPNSQMSASSTYLMREAHRGRLNSTTPWCGYFIQGRGLYIDLDFKDMFTITAVAIQGGLDTGYKGRWPTRVFFWIAQGTTWVRTGFYDILSQSENEVTTIQFPKTYNGNRIMMVILDGHHKENQVCARLEVYGCQAVSCGTPTDISNGRIIDDQGSFYQDTVKYKCDDGYQMVESDSITCLASGSWSDSPQCKAVSCGTPTDISKGRIIDDQGSFYQDTVKYKCDVGYQMVESDSITCLASGSWSDSPQCKGISCGSTGGLRDGNVRLTGYGYLDVATYTCKVGYTLKGSAKQTCRDSPVIGWDGSKPKCEAIICTAPVRSTNGDWSGSSLKYNSRITYTCNTGYTTTDARTSAYCLSDGTWSSGPPQCTETKCGSPTEAGFVVLEGYGFRPMDMAKVGCSGGMKLIGSPYITCGSNGKWDLSNAKCEVSCDTPLEFESGRLPNGQMSAMSTYFGRETHPHRLNSANPLCGNPSTNGRPLHIYLIFKDMVNITAVAIQGGLDKEFKKRWPTRFMFWIARGTKWTTTQYYNISPRSVNEVTTIKFSKTYTANRIIMVIVNGNQAGNHVCTRLEVYGCKDCVDEDTKCPGWAASERDYCSNDKYVKTNCEKSCGTCPTA